MNNNMTPEQQRETIANACGYVQLPNGDWRGPTMTVGSCGIPNYLGCLNAMHEAEKVIPDLGLYRRFLYLVVLDDPSNHANDPAWATAAQRAEAFLRTIGKWVES